MEQLYTESKAYLREIPIPAVEYNGDIPNIEGKLRDHILSTTQAGNPGAIINAIDLFCMKNWMMNLGPDKGRIVVDALKKASPKRILEIGGYCGYSALVLAFNSNALVHTIQIDPFYAQIASSIHKHAGLQDKIEIHVGTVDTSAEYLKQFNFDFVFIDHVKGLYLKDFLTLNAYGVLPKGACIVGDNIIYPGSPDYLAYFKESKDYRSCLYHGYLEYTNRPDAVLVSTKLV